MREERRRKAVEEKRRQRLNEERVRCHLVLADFVLLWRDVRF